MNSVREAEGGVAGAGCRGIGRCEEKRDTEEDGLLNAELCTAL